MPEDKSIEGLVNQAHDQSIDEHDGAGVQLSETVSEASEDSEQSGEIVMNLDKVIEGQRMKFSIPGISQVGVLGYLQSRCQNYSGLIYVTEKVA